MHIEEDKRGFTVKFRNEGEFYDYEDGASSLAPGAEIELDSGGTEDLSLLWERINASWEQDMALSYIPRYSKVCTKGFKGGKNDLVRAMGRILEGT